MTLPLAGYPPDSLQLHVSVVRNDGITVYDACPSRTDFEHFTASDEFRGALAAAGLPRPRIEPIGEVSTARIAQPLPA